MTLRPPGVRRAFGQAVEAEVAGWLEARGCEVLDRNFRVRGGEVDLVVRHRGVVAFVEVRSRHDGRHGLPEESVGRAKIRRIVLAARLWAARHGAGEGALRFDVVAVEGEGPAREIRWYQGAFGAGP